MNFRLRFPKDRVNEWAARYGDAMDDAVPSSIGPVARQRGHLLREEFLAVTRWKSPRTQPRCAENAPEFIEAVTRVALSTSNEQLCIQVLTLLRGVAWPTASVILHFCATRPYPVLDFRALWSLSCDAEAADYDFMLWEAYVAETRSLATECGVSMRTLDRALWAYSKVRQRVGT
ncbi:MAG: hypothetical protein IT357_04025 [Gemmatimonadaceae bacterium]|nr:hypothetical protein [Gemmatimonadaceae bacterium]